MITERVGLVAKSFWLQGIIFILFYLTWIADVFVMLTLFIYFFIVVNGSSLHVSQLLTLKILTHVFAANKDTCINKPNTELFSQDGNQNFAGSTTALKMESASRVRIPEQSLAFWKLLNLFYPS